ncbi:ribonucleotide reductase inhibitor-domain-containing protein [Hypoxylon sp. NC1633]|nr:ribonucleotide reductase inhibitor-domain-containing protein [Hypoxylon sp. NC1633]
MSAPRTKRQFAGAASDPAQRQITSFFTSSPLTSTHIDQSSPTQSSTSDIYSPALPESVQANLLSVGMRVRKSVPEGYKTGSYSAFALWDKSGKNTKNFIPASATTMGEGRSRANAISTPRELLPFCGIHKVGGLGTQPDSAPTSSPLVYTPTSTSTYIPPTYKPRLSINGMPLEDDSMDDVPGLTSSQETVESTDSSASPAAKTRKRSYTEDEDERPETPDRLHLNLDVNVWRDAFDGEVSPRSQAPVGWRPGNARVMAVPRKNKFRGGAGGSGSGKLASRTMGQENVMVVDDAAGDFGEADFLVRTADLGYAEDWEVEMSDV